MPPEHDKAKLLAAAKVRRAAWKARPAGTKLRRPARRPAGPAGSEGPASDSPVALEPDGGNLYRPHKLQVTSGQFWRCAHGLTGFKSGFHFIGCTDCAKYEPAAHEAWRVATNDFTA